MVALPTPLVPPKLPNFAVWTFELILVPDLANWLFCLFRAPWACNLVLTTSRGQVTIEETKPAQAPARAEACTIPG